MQNCLTVAEFEELMTKEDNQKKYNETLDEFIEHFNVEYLDYPSFLLEAFEEDPNMTDEDIVSILIFLRHSRSPDIQKKYDRLIDELIYYKE